MQKIGKYNKNIRASLDGILMVAHGMLEAKEIMAKWMLVTSEAIVVMMFVSSGIYMIEDSAPKQSISSRKEIVGEIISPATIPTIENMPK